MWQKVIGTYPVTWPDQTDEWAFHMGVALEGHPWLGGLGTSPVERVVIFDPPSSRSCRMRVEPAPGGIVCTVLGDEAPGNEGDARRWRDAAELAASLIGRRDQDFNWRAILGPHPAGLDLPRSVPLAEPSTLGPVLLTPGGVRMREPTGPSYGRIDAGTFRYTWPLIATGTVRAYSPDPVDHLAQRLTHRACALLSLWTGASWIPRRRAYVPAPNADSGSLPGVPQSIGDWDVFRLPDESLPADFNVYDGHDGPPLVIPAWLERAWDLMSIDEVLTKAIHAYNEAISMESQHPSMAFLLYVAAIEGIGARFVGLTHCKHCNSQTGARQRFKAALGTVQDKEALEYLARVAYDVRSETGHAGSLFGAEDSYGYGTISLFQWRDADLFDYELLWPMRKACRGVIREIVRAAQPPTAGAESGPPRQP